MAETSRLNEPIQGGEGVDLAPGGYDEPPHVLTTYTKPAPIGAAMTSKD